MKVGIPNLFARELKPRMPRRLFFEDREGIDSKSDEEDNAEVEHVASADAEDVKESATVEKGKDTESGRNEEKSADVAENIGEEEIEGDEEGDNSEDREHVEIRVGVRSKEQEQPKSGGIRKAVWVDEDDEQQPVNLHKVKRRRKLRKAMGEKHVSGTEYGERIRDLYATKPGGGAGGPGTWAELPSERKTTETSQDKEGSFTDDDGSDDDDDEQPVNANKLLQSTTRLLASRKRATGSGIVDQEYAPLRSGILNLRRVTNANEEDPNKAEARCVEFHPSGRLLLTAGLDKTLRIFQVDGKQNAKVQGVHMRNFPIHTARFTGGGTQVVMAGRRRHFHQLDMNTGAVSTLHTLSTHEERAWDRFEVSSDGSKLAFFGQQGKIVLLSNRTKREIGQLRLNARVASVAFAAEGANENHIYATSQDGTVYLWDARRMDCIDRHKDEGAIHNTSLATSRAHYALGSDSGVVNVYSSGAMRTSSQAPVFGTRTEKPEKSFFNLTTAIDNVAFNSDGKLLAFSSHDKKNAVKIAHIPTMTVYSNWPSARANLHRACCLRFSPKSGYLAIGNDKGAVHLMRLASYPAA